LQALKYTRKCPKCIWKGTSNVSLCWPQILY